MTNEKFGNSVHVFDTINDESLAPNPSDLIFWNDGVEYVFERMDGDNIVAQPCNPNGDPDSSLPRLKANKSLLRAEGFRIKNQSSQ